MADKAFTLFDLVKQDIRTMVVSFSENGDIDTIEMSIAIRTNDPLEPIRFTHSILKGHELSPAQKTELETVAATALTKTREKLGFEARVEDPKEVEIIEAEIRR
jgi:hypothetical protein